MSLTSYRAAPPRAIRAFEAGSKGKIAPCDALAAHQDRGGHTHAAALARGTAVWCQTGKEALSLAGPAMTYSPGS